MGRRALVVDDDEDNAVIAGSMLRAQGFEVRVAYDGASALKAVEEERPDLILLDVMMPKMNGLEVLERIRADPRNASIPVILVTAKTQDDDVLAGYKSGADYYITKPFTSRQLLHGIGLVLGTESQE
jgi:DNA-binding response OmpR family regulator